MTVRHDDEAQLVEAARAGDEAAFTTLFRRWFDPCYDVARRIVGPDAGAEVAQETFLAAWRQLDTLRDPGAFGGWVLRAARNRALNRLDRERRSRPVDHDEPVLAGLRSGADVEGDVVSGLSTAEQESLVRAAAAVLGEREASVLDLHLRHGLGAPELADELGVTPNNAHQLLFRMRRRLGAGIRAWVLFRAGDPECRELGLALAADGVSSFGRPAVATIDRHLEHCADCEARQASVLAPEALFAAVPVVALAPALKGPIVDALRRDGVPLGPDAAAGVSGEPGATTPESAGGARGSDRPTDADTVTGGSRPRPGRGVVALAAAGVLAVLVLVGAAASRSDDATDVEALASGARPSTTDAPRATWGSTTTTTAAPGAIPAPAPTSVPPEESGVTTTTAVRSGDPGGDPGYQPPPPGPPTPPAAPTTAPPAPTTTAPLPPTVVSFTAAPGVGTCVNGFPTTLAWRTTGATSVSIRSIGIALHPSLDGKAPIGTAVGCIATPGPPPGGWRLTATGPGGTTVATVP